MWERSDVMDLHTLLNVQKELRQCYIELLLERLQYRDVSDQAKKVIVQELMNMGVNVVKCVCQPSVKGMLKTFEEDQNYVVSRETTKSVWIFDAKGIERRFTNHGDEALETGMNIVNVRTVVALS